MIDLPTALRQHLPRRVWSGYARVSDLDRDQFETEMQLPLPTNRYVMFFTPRSGSSWVADLLSRTKRLGRVIECFNPNFMPNMTRSVNAATLQEYCALLPRRLQSGDSFGFQVTLFQMRAVFSRDKDFLNLYADQPWIWLIRSDIVLQAVSLYKMEMRQITHAPQMKGRSVVQAEQTLAYDGKRIRYWLDHILSMEQETEALFKQAGQQPLRLNYERNAAMKPNHIVNVIARHSGRGTLRMRPLHSPHGKVGTDQNTAFADRFRSENPEFLARITEDRAERVENSLGYGPKGSF